MQKNIFLLWLQGWDKAPWLQKEVLKSWEINNILKIQNKLAQEFSNDKFKIKLNNFIKKSMNTFNNKKIN